MRRVDESAVIALSLAPALAVVGVLTWSVTKSNAHDGSVPNNVAGMRTRATKSSPEAWVRGHRAAVPAATSTMRLGVVLAVAALALSLGSLALPQIAVLALVVAIVGFVVVVGGCLYACLMADRAARGQTT